MNGFQRTQLILFVNGRKIVEDNPDPEETLLNFIRRKLCLTGTKLGCAEGGCGACTVMVSRYDRSSRTIRHHSVNACLAPLCSMHGMAVTTVEGIGSTRSKLHSVQDCLAKSHGSQCGFCTPGFVMSMYTLIRNNCQPSESEMESALQGNLCRCTGYRPIIEGFRLIASGRTNNAVTNGDSRNGHEVPTNGQTESVIPTNDTQEPIFPSELQLEAELFETSPLLFQSDRVTWYRPTSLADLLLLKHLHPAAKLVVGNTEIGVEIKFKNMHYPVIIAATHVPELKTVEVQETGIRLGASVSLTTVEETFKETIKSHSENKTRYFSAFVEMLRWFAGNQIRNVAAIGGNLITASPISDLNPLLQAAGCTVTFASHTRGIRTVKIDGSFFIGYRKTIVSPDEILMYIDVPFSSEDIYFEGFKQAQRKEDDIAIVNAGMMVRFDDDQVTIKEMRISYGGIAPTTVLASRTASQLVGRQWMDELPSAAYKLLLEELPLPAGSPGGMEAYRCSLTISFFFKFYLFVRLQLESKTPTLFPSVTPAKDRSAVTRDNRPPSVGVQLYDQVGDDQLKVDAVGRPLPHVSAQRHTTGEAAYVDDMPVFRDELNLALVFSTKAHADILDIDATDALTMPGVVDFICRKDVPGSNAFTTCTEKDEEIFATNVVTCQGQVIGAIVAETKVHAQRAAKVVKVTYKERSPVIITIEQAIEANSFFGQPQSINKGDLTAAFAEADHVIEGEAQLGGQEHFYLETQSCIAVPKEDGEMELYSSTQGITALQGTVADALGVDYSKILVRTKRLGGGFGGKESRSVVLACPVAIAANKCNRPVRAMLDRDEDMISTGTRHPFRGKYKVGFSKAGKILALQLNLYANCGNTHDFSQAVIWRALSHCDNCYLIPNLSVTGYACKTNLPSCTAFRGFGAPQGIFILESIISHIASFLQTSENQLSSAHIKVAIQPTHSLMTFPENLQYNSLQNIFIRELNLYNEGDLTHYNQVLTDFLIKKCWQGVMKQSDYETKKRKVEEFNRNNRWKKRGLSVTPTKHGIGYEVDFLNTGAALVHIYLDGSVLIAHGGVEMGQGLHTKMIQVASRVFQIPITYIRISETTNMTIPNAAPSAASVGSDMYGMAVLNACQTLMDRITPYKKASPTAGWKQWVTAAYLNCDSLSATGYYSAPNATYDEEKNCGDKFLYFTCGAACCEVEIDCLTGDHTVLSTDIVMDIGKSLNPAIDVGQIEGAFVQGYGLLTLEELKYTLSGYLLSRGPGTYKIPACSNIPVEFNVTLLKDGSNPKAVYSSKGIGEPPLALAMSAFFAIKDAISSARKDAGISGPFKLDSPATSERIRMACVDDLTRQVPEYKEGTFTPWNITF